MSQIHMDLLEGKPSESNLSSDESQNTPIFSDSDEKDFMMPDQEKVSFSDTESSPENTDLEQMKSHKSSNEHLQKFLSSLAEQPDVESKLKFVLQFMEDALAQGGAPNFKYFWEGRRASIELFRETSLSPNARFQLWNKYTELTNEGNRLKAILDEQSAFAAEQIDIAISAIEKDISEHANGNSKTDIVEFPESQVLAPKIAFYHDVQGELNLLNRYASRINGLRKELIKTEMRVRHKNKFFQRLSAAGDHVFPKRKELIKQVSQQFTQDVDAFIDESFKDENHKRSPFYLREEIKSLQGMAKVLTLNTQSFTQTRLRLSDCWDKVKHLEKERKKERAQLREVSKQHENLVQEKIKEFLDVFSEMTVPQAQTKLNEITGFMRSQVLAHDEVKYLREELNKLRKMIQEKQRADEDAKQKLEQDRLRQKQELIQQFHQRIDSVWKNADSYDANSLAAERDTLMQDIQNLAIAKLDKVELEKLLKPFKDLISKKKELALFAMSDDDRQAYQQLLDIYKERKEERQECKTLLESHRKVSGSSGLDFEKAMSYNELINEEKQRLERINQSIKEIEDKIRQLEKRLNKANS